MGDGCASRVRETFEDLRFDIVNCTFMDFAAMSNAYDLLADAAKNGVVGFNELQMVADYYLMGFDADEMQNIYGVEFDVIQEYMGGVFATL